MANDPIAPPTPKAPLPKLPFSIPSWVVTLVGIVIGASPLWLPLLPIEVQVPIQGLVSVIAGYLGYSHPGFAKGGTSGAIKGYFIALSMTAGAFMIRRCLG